MIVDEALPPKKMKQPLLGDFSGMSSILDSIQLQVAKQQTTKQRSGKKQKAEDAQKEKERLQKIINLNSFQSNAIDAIF